MATVTPGSARESLGEEDDEEEDEDIEKSEDMLISISDISDSISQWTYFLVEAPRYGDDTGSKQTRFWSCS